MSEDPLEDTSTISNVASPGLDLDIDALVPPPPVKRKGGRKPVYATLEERKQRNRQAQAAFRERRTEYIKQLEIAMKENEETTDRLQQSNREAMEECHMLRYKTSMLEDLLYENGIDYQSELQARSSKSLLGAPYPAQGSARAQWTQQELQRDKRQRLQHNPHKAKAKGKGPNAQSIASHQAQSSYSPTNAHAHRLSALSIQPDPINTGQANFHHSNGGVHSLHHPFHGHFEDPQLDPPISDTDPAGSYFSPDEHHMAHYLGK